MVSALRFKGEKAKKRKRPREDAPRTTAVEGSDQAKRRVDDEIADADDSWVSADVPTDLSGPILFVLPGNPPCALSCDANGKVFPLVIENIVDGLASTAEPHDVRQVWIANPIVGTTQFRFKGHHGKYLRCDKHGIFSAVSEAVSPLETFSAVAAETPSTFYIRSTADTYLSAKATSKESKTPEIRGDAETPSEETTLRIRMQARFKPRLRASKEEKVKEKISRRDLETAVGRSLDEDEVKRLKRARREGDYQETLLEFKVKGKHDKYC